MSVWDSCILEVEEGGLIASFCKASPAPASSSSSSSSSTAAESRTDSKASTVGNDDGDELEVPEIAHSNVDSLQQSLEAAELSCRSFRQELDGILYTLGEVSVEFNDVTGRTNNLMLNCEALLEKQHSLELTVEKLRNCLKPFEDVEIIARSLGIPLDAKSSKSNSSNTEDSILAATGPNSGTYNRSSTHGNSGGNHVITDPRSPEFKELLVRMAASHRFLDEHREYMDSDKYHHWVVQLRSRASSLVARAMRALLDGATKQAAEAVSAITSDSASRFTPMAALATKMLIDDSPIEGASLYRKFRGLGFRLKELAALLQVQVRSPQGEHNTVAGAAAAAAAAVESDVEEDHATLDEVKQAYIGMRQQLLVPFVHALSIAKPVHAKAQSGQASTSAATATVTKTKSQLTLPGRDDNFTLCPAIHHAYAMLLRVCQLEQQLFISLFWPDEDGDGNATDSNTQGEYSSGGSPSGPVSAPSTPVANSSAHTNQQTPQSTSANTPFKAGKGVHALGTPPEVLTIVGSLCNTICDGLRPLIIHESDVDELCRVAGTLADDIRSQIASIRAPIAIQRALEAGMDRTICDTQERLSYVAEIRLRQEVQSFKPTLAHLAYPDILEAATTATASTASSDPSIEEQQQEFELSSTWYPPLRQTLALLSKLYGVVENTVFEDFARRAVHQCVLSLRQASESVARNRSVLHGDLFLVRHLLILREQLLPFDARLTGTERSLDFRSTGLAWTHFASNARSLLKFDTNNSLWQLAKEGLPGLHEDNVDAKRELDAVLKAACLSLKINAVRMLLAGLDGWLAKIIACIGEIPITHDNTSASEKDRLAAPVNAPPVLPADHIALLRNQAFIRPQRVLEVLNEAQTSVASGVTELRAIMKLYVDNTIARTILMKPVQQEVEAVRRKVETILASCVDAGQPRRDLEQLIAAIALTVDTHLLQQ